MTTTRAPSRQRPGARAPAAVAELVLPLLTVVSGLQLLRLMVSTVLAVYRDRLGAPLVNLALFAVGSVALGLLAVPLAHLLGRRRALVLAAAGVALVRLAVQLLPDGVLRWLLAPAGVVVFLWFVALWLARDGAGFGLALLGGLAVDTALHGLGGGWDYAWSINLWTVVLAALLAGAALWALAAVAGREWRGPVPRRPAAVLPLAGIGPALFLHALIWQNLGWQAVLGRFSPDQAFLLVMAANLAALAAGVAAGRVGPGRLGRPVVGAALAGLAVAMALEEAAAVAACLLGQAAVAVLLVAIIGRATRPADRPGRGGWGLGGLVAAWTGGMVLFVLLVFAYYAVYDLVLPFGNGVVPVAAAVLVALAGALAGWVGSPGTRTAGGGSRAVEGRLRPGGGLRRRGPVATGVAVGLLLAPVMTLASAPDPVRAEPGRAAVRPVRLLSYNLHFGFDVRGWSDLEAAARAIERSGAEVVGLQEVSRGWYINGSTDMLAWLQRRLRMPYARFAGASDAIWGNAVLSRYPILADGVVRLPREGVPLRRNALWAELDLGGGRRLRVVATHLHHVEGPAGARVRQAQIPRLLEAVAGRPATVLLGDLNAEPGSREIAMVEAAGLRDAFAAGGGRPADELTYPSDRPARRIDYLWLSRDLRASGFAATTGTASDHRGVAVTVAADPS